MLRSKSPFKKKSPKVPEEEVPPSPHESRPPRAPTNPNQPPDDCRPSMRQWNSVQEFQELQKERHLLNGNAFAQQQNRKSGGRERSATVSYTFFYQASQAPRHCCIGRLR